MDKLDRKDQEIVWQKFKELIKNGFDVSVCEHGNHFDVGVGHPFNISNTSDSLFWAIDGVLENIDSLRETEKANQHWQLCPVCGGTGNESGYPMRSAVDKQCSVCHGEKIISTLNGQPPSKQ